MKIFNNIIDTKIIINVINHIKEQKRTNSHY